MRHILTIALASLSLASVGAARAGAAAYTVTTIKAPGITGVDGVYGAYGAIAGGINNAGQVTGHYSDANGSEHGFVDTGGVLTRIDVPGAPYTEGHGINASGQVVGDYRSAFTQGYPRGFVDTNGTFALIEVPKTGVTIATGINDSGQVVGYSIDNPSNPFSGYHGFVDINGILTSFDVPGARAGSTVALSINNAGQIAGSYADALTGAEQGFVDTNGVFTEITVPNALVDTPPADPTRPHRQYVSTYVEGINNIGQLVGFYEDDNGTHAFVDTNGVFAVFNPPGLQFSIGFLFDLIESIAINDVGQIAGNYAIFDRRTTFYNGFVADPVGGETAVPEPASAALLAFGLASLGLVKRRKAA